MKWSYEVEAAIFRSLAANIEKEMVDGEVACCTLPSGLDLECAHMQLESTNKKKKDLDGQMDFQAKLL